jgi:ssDNA-binding Zn-finger/Zn-ribbon topoisomerase 1
MGRDRQMTGACEKCGQAALWCSHNRFHNGELTIDSWEHRCTNCGQRETKAFRSDAPQAGPADPLCCPFCGRRSAAGEG